jgi:hypothetical protein
MIVAAVALTATGVTFAAALVCAAAFDTIADLGDFE